MNTYTRNGGWQTSTTGVDISQRQRMTQTGGDYYYHPYTIEFDTGNDRITQAMIESINRSIGEIYLEDKAKKDLSPFDDDELNALLFEEES